MALAGSIARTAGLGLHLTLDTLGDLLASGFVATAGQGWLLARRREGAAKET